MDTCSNRLAFALISRIILSYNSPVAAWEQKTSKVSYKNKVKRMKVRTISAK